MQIHQECLVKLVLNLIRFSLLFSIGNKRKKVFKFFLSALGAIQIQTNWEWKIPTVKINPQAATRFEIA